MAEKIAYTGGLMGVDLPIFIEKSAKQSQTGLFVVTIQLTLTFLGQSH